MVDVTCYRKYSVLKINIDLLVRIYENLNRSRSFDVKAFGVKYVIHYKLEKLNIIKFI